MKGKRRITIMLAMRGYKDAGTIEDVWEASGHIGDCAVIA